MKTHTMGRKRTCTLWDGHARAMLFYAMLMLLLCYSFFRVLHLGLLQMKGVPWDGRGPAHHGTHILMLCFPMLCYANAMLCLRVFHIIPLELNYENGKGHAHHGTDMDTRTMGRK